MGHEWRALGCYKSLNFFPIVNKFSSITGKYSTPSFSASHVSGLATDEVVKIQVRETIREHFEKEVRIAQLPQDQRMKVLSLFFVDRVAHYAEADGKFRQWFVELYEELSKLPGYAALNPLPVEKVHNGY